MKSIRRHPLFFLFCACFFLALARSAVAQENYYNSTAKGTEDAGSSDAEAAPASKTHTVTSLQKCYASIGREEALDIQMNFVKPYQECQKRLAAQLQKKQKESVKEAAATEKQQPPSERTGGFYRVQKPAVLENKTPVVTPDSEGKPLSKPLF